MKVILIKREGGKLDLIVKHTQPWEGPTIYTRNLSRADLKEQARLSIEQMRANLPASMEGLKR